MTPDDDQQAKPKTISVEPTGEDTSRFGPQIGIAYTDEHALIALRRAKLEQLRQAGPAFPNDFRRNALAAELQGRYGALDNEALEARPVEVSVAGRMLAQRVMGKASFATLQDMSGPIQLFVQREAVGEVLYAAFKTWDVGDIVGAARAAIDAGADLLSLINTLVGLSIDIERPKVPNVERWYAALRERPAYREHVMLAFDELYGRPGG